MGDSTVICEERVVDWLNKEFSDQYREDVEIQEFDGYWMMHDRYTAVTNTLHRAIAFGRDGDIHVTVTETKVYVSFDGYEKLAQMPENVSLWVRGF